MGGQPGFSMNVVWEFPELHRVFCECTRGYCDFTSKWSGNRWPCGLSCSSHKITDPSGTSPGHGKPLTGKQSRVLVHRCVWAGPHFRNLGRGCGGLRSPGLPRPVVLHPTNMTPEPPGSYPVAPLSVVCGAPVLGSLGSPLEIQNLTPHLDLLK